MNDVVSNRSKDLCIAYTPSIVFCHIGISDTGMGIRTTLMFSSNMAEYRCIYTGNDSVSHS